MALSHDDVREILRIIDESDLDELTIETDGFRLSVSKGHATGMSGAEGTRVDEVSAGTGPSGAPAETPSTRAPDHEHATPDDGLIEIPSPMLGTFYGAESPGAAPFVEVGARVEPDTIVCIIEVMKMMNSVPAGVTGTVSEVCGNNGQLVEYGEPLFRVQPQ
jgi:acetyl-CoA carboxylase biotin carboxyl carrier protein